MAQLPIAGVGAILITIALAYGTAIGGVLGLLGVIGLLGSVYSRRDGLILFGPFAAWELVRTARHKRLFVFRTLLAAAVLGYLLLNFAQIFDRDGKVFVAHNEMSQRAEEIFIFIGITICGFSLLFSTFTFPAILSEERETKRLDHLLVTDLRNSEIILGKMAGRVAVLLGYTMTLIPILALLSFLGGVDLNKLIIGSVVLFLLLLGLMGISIACSAMTSFTTSAVRNTIGFVLLTSALIGIINLIYAVLLDAGWKSTRVDSLINFFSLVSPFYAFHSLGNISNLEINDPDVLQFLRQLAATQWTLFSLGWWIATSYLRQPARRHRPEADTTADAQKPAVTVEPRSRREKSNRPPVTDEPVYWYEMYGSTRGLGKWLAQLFRYQYWLIPVFTLLLLLLLALLINDFKSIMVGILMISGHIAFWMISFPVGVTASRLIARERQLDTLDALLLSPLEIQDIIHQKWWAAVMRSRVLFLIFLTVWSTGLFSGKMNGFAFVAVILTTLANTCLAASVGMFFSIRSRTAAIASGKYVGYSFLWSIGVLFCLTCCARGAGSADNTAFLVICFSLVPVVPQTMSSFLTEALQHGSSAVPLFTVLLGIAVSSVLAAIIRNVVVVTFEEQVRPKLPGRNENPYADKGRRREGGIGKLER